MISEKGTSDQWESESDDLKLLESESVNLTFEHSWNRGFHRWKSESDDHNLLES